MARVRTTTFQKRKEQGEKIPVLTAYDFPTARLMDECGLEAILVGDSVGYTVQGHEGSLSVTMDTMVYHTEMVSRAVKRAMVIGDMPFLSYQISPEEAVRNAGRLVSEGGANAVKLEGPADRFGSAIKAILNTGIPVMGHIGLTPQSVNQIGGYKIQGRGEEAARRLMAEALGLQEAGCFAIVLELVQAEIAREISKTLRIPTIGIGSGAGCDGQVLVLHDMFNMGLTTSFAKVYYDMRTSMAEAFRAYVSEVQNGIFPGPEHEFK